MTRLLLRRIRILLALGFCLFVRGAWAIGEISKEIEAEWKVLIDKDFPTLRNVDIKLDWSEDREDFTQTALNRWPILMGKKVYVIKVSRPLWIKGPPRDILKAIWAHELAHIKNYQDMSFFGLFHYGVQYKTDLTFRVEAEHAADKAVLKLGYGKELAAYREWLYTAIPTSSLDEKQKLYWSPGEIRDWMRTHPPAGR